MKHSNRIAPCSPFMLATLASLDAAVAVCDAADDGYAVALRVAREIDSNYNREVERGVLCLEYLAAHSGVALADAERILDARRDEYEAANAAYRALATSPAAELLG